MKRPSDLPPEFKGVWVWQCMSCPARVMTRIMPESVYRFVNEHRKQTGHDGTFLVSDRYD